MFDFIKSRTGSVAVYSAVFAMLALSAGSIAIDLGQLVTLKAQLQHRADAGATAGAIYLDRTPGARQRASDVAVNATTDKSNIASDSTELAVGTIKFYSEYNPAKVLATGDADARMIEVIMERRLVDFFFTPFFKYLAANSVVANSASLGASAVAQSGPLLCRGVPLMMCDLTEIGGEDVMDPANAGRMVILKAPQAGSGLWAPGNFGPLLSPYGPGADNLEQNLADVGPIGCDGPNVTTEPGAITIKVRSGINARFNRSRFPFPAPNVQGYPRDNSFGSVDDDSHLIARLGDGDWNAIQYWSDAHDGDSLPTALHQASRYQVYLYELGETFGRDGKQTIYPVHGSLATEFTLVGPSGADLPVDGQPLGAVASNGPARRLMEIVVLKCVQHNVIGSHTYPTDAQFIEVFVTEAVSAPPNAAIYAEIVRKLTPLNSDKVYSNSGLVD